MSSYNTIIMIGDSSWEIHLCQAPNHATNYLTIQLVGFNDGLGEIFIFALPFLQRIGLYIRVYQSTSRSQVHVLKNCYMYERVDLRFA